MIPGMSFSSSYPNRLKHRTRYSRGWTVSRGLAVAGCPRGLHPLHGLLSSWSPPSSLVPPSSTISTSLTWFVCTTLPPPPLCTPPVRPNPYTRSCSFFPLFFFSLPAPADHSTCGDCQRRQGPGELSCEWLDTTCKRGWAWRSEEPAVNTFDIFLVQHKQRFVLWGDIVFATLRLLVAHNHGPWGYSVSCVHRFIHNHANVSNRQVYVYVFSSTLFFWSAMMIVMVS